MNIDSAQTQAYFYAKVIFALAVTQNNILEWEKVLKVLVAITQDNEIKDVCFSPRFTLQQRLLLVTEIYAAMRITLFPTALSFMRLFLEKRHFNLAARIAQSYSDLQDYHSDVLKMRVISAQELTEEEKLALLDSVTACYQCQIKPNYVIDQALIGGAIIYVKDKVIDASVLGQLQQLKNFLR